MKKPLNSWIIIGLIILAFALFNRITQSNEKIELLTQVDFEKALQENRLASPITRYYDSDKGETFLVGEIMRGEKLADGEMAREKYKVMLVPGENEQLMEMLRAAKIPVKIERIESALSPFITQLIFFIAFIFIFYWFFGRRLGGSDGPLGMGKSRAKLLTGEEKGPKITFDDVAGIDEAKEEVQEIVEFLKQPDSFRKLGGRIPKGVLLVGPPGTGKTLLAKAIAGEAKVPFFAISGSDFEEMFVGVGASRMRGMFADAKKRAPCIIFIDEIDSIGMKRSGSSAIPSSHTYEQTLNTMLVEMDGFDANEGVIVIAATNRPDTLDAALLRPGRFDRQVFIDLPTLKGREEILHLHGKKIKFAEDVDLTRVARGTPGFSGADLANLLNESALMAVRKKLEAVDMATLDEARDKVLWGRERKSAGYSKNDREITAWHESGHAILQLSLKHTDPLHKVTIIPRGRALGATMSLPEKDVLNHTKAQFLDELVVLCGGRIAEEMFTGDISTGAAQDIAQATEIARNMICNWAMSDKFGFQAFREKNSFAASDLPPAFSEKTSQEIDEEVSRLVREAYAQAKAILEEKREKLKMLAEALLEKETMDGRDIEKLLSGEPLTEIASGEKAAKDETASGDNESSPSATVGKATDDAKNLDSAAKDKPEKDVK